VPLPLREDADPCVEDELVRRFGPRVWAYEMRHLRNEQRAAARPDVRDPASGIECLVTAVRVREVGDRVERRAVIGRHHP
jgi:hypothetical protein